MLHYDYLHRKKIIEAKYNHKKINLWALASIRTDLSLTALYKLLLPGLTTFLD